MNTNGRPSQQTVNAASGSSVREELGSTLMEVKSETSVQAAEIEAMVKARCVLARSMPRDEKRVRAKVLADCQRPVFADKAIYSKPVGGAKPIEGASVRLAESVARHFGNISVDATIAEDTPERRRIRVHAMDLETNYTAAQDVIISKLIERTAATMGGRQAISTRRNSKGGEVFLVEATEDELLNKTNAAVSKMRRNKIIEVVPSDLIEDALSECNKTLDAEAKKDPVGVRKKLVEAFLQLGVRAEALISFVGHPLDQLTPVEVNDLRRVYNSIKDGETTWQATVEAKAAQSATPGGPATKAPPGPAVKADPPVEEDVDPPHDPKTGEILEDQEAAAARERMRLADEQATAAAAKPVETAPPVPPVQTQLGIDFSATDATDQLIAKMNAVAEDPKGTMDQLSALHALAAKVPNDRRSAVDTLFIKLRRAVSGRKA